MPERQRMWFLLDIVNIATAIVIQEKYYHHEGYDNVSEIKFKKDIVTALFNKDITKNRLKC